ncbi:MAG: hypothetical protein ACJ73E_14350 [Mycobacteriales bacterium]
MSGPDVLGSGPDRGPAAGLPERVRSVSGAARRRRWTGLAGTVLVVAAAAVLAVRSLPEPSVPPPPAPTPTALVAEPVRFVGDAAVGTRWAYVLVASCLGPEDTRQCRYRLLRRSPAGGDWTPTALQTGPVAGATGPARLFVTAGDQVTVVDQPTVGNVYVSPDGGDTVSEHALSVGTPIAAVPAGAFIDLGLCESCMVQLTVLEPRSGRLRMLARPPRLGSTVGIRSFAESGGALWVLGDGGSRLISAVSLDRGRSWRVLPVGGARAPADFAALASDGGRGAYLLIGRDTRPDVESEFSELWRVSDPTRPGAAWRQVTPAVRPRSAVGLLTTGRGLLLRDDGGDLWRLAPDGRMRRLPPVRVGGVPVAPALVVRGPGPLLIGVLGPPGAGPPTVLLSPDGGDTWRVERVPA